MHKLILAGCVVATIPVCGGVVCSGDSAAVALDLRRDVEPVLDSIVLPWDAEWIGGDAGATVVISDNGTEVKRTTGAGEFTHTLSGGGRHELSYATFIGGVAQGEVYTTTVYAPYGVVTFDANGGSVDEQSRNVASGCAVGELPVPVRISYTFASWWTTSSGGTQIIASTTVKDNVTYYAHWTPIKYTVTFDANGGTGGWSRSLDYDSAIVAPTVTRKGYTFKGWSPSVAATVPANDVTYTAQWEINAYYIITLDANGGVCATDTITVEYGTKVGELPIPTREDATFFGWFTAADGGEKVEASVIVTEAMTLYAHWQTEALACKPSNDANYGEKNSWVYANCKAEGIMGVEGTCSVQKVPGTNEYCYTFTNVGQTTTFTPHTDLYLSQALIVGGGGAGGWAGGGGGGGGVHAIAEGMWLKADEPVSVTVGEGGSNYCSSVYDDTNLIQCGGNGGFSRLSIGGVDYMAYGGGGGASFYTLYGQGNNNGVQLATGGGNANVSQGVAASGATGLNGLMGLGGGGNGGTAHGNTTGGGGGAGGNGARGDTGNPETLDDMHCLVDLACGDGGTGWPSTITGVEVYYGGGGGGGDGRVFTTSANFDGHLYYQWRPNASSPYYMIRDSTYGSELGNRRPGNGGEGGGGKGGTTATGGGVNIGYGEDGTDGLGGGGGGGSCWSGNYFRSGGKGGDGVVILRIADVAYNRYVLQPKYAESAQPCGIRSPWLADGFSSFSFDYVDADVNAVLLLQVNTNLTSMSGIYDATMSLSRWQTVEIFTFTGADATAGTRTVHIDCRNPGLVRLIADPSVVIAAMSQGDTEYGAISIASASVELGCVSEDEVVAFDANGGVCETETAMARHGEAIGELPVPTRENAVFTGWFTDPAGGVKVDASWVAKSSGTLYAHWLTEVAAPVIATVGGLTTFRTDSCEVSITCDTEGVAIYYTDDGSTPRKNDDYLYAGPITITETTTFKAIAVVGELRSDYTTVTITKNQLTLNEALDVGEEVTITTSVAMPWTSVLDSNARVGDTTAQSGEIGNRTNTWLSATVSGAGTMTFWCKVSCEHDEDNMFSWDRFMVYTNDVEIEEWRMDGETDWTERTLVFSGGENTVKWVYYKDRTGAEGEDCAWVDAITWTPAGAANVTVDVGGGKTVTVPATWLAEKTQRTATDTAANGRKVWECYVLGLDPESATNDFKITSFQMKADGTPDLEHLVFDPPQSRWNVQGAQPVIKGVMNLDDAIWSEVTEQNKASFRFFKVEVVLP